MSTIVAVRKNGKACIAADTLTTFGDCRQAADMDADSEKILSFEESYLGIVGSAAHHLVVQSALRKLKQADFSSRPAVFETLCELHPLLKENYFLNPKDEEDDAYESTHIDSLLVNETGIYGIYALREVFEYTTYWAIGAGSEFALGAMYAVYDKLESAEEIAKVGIEAGAKFNTDTALPMTLYSVDLAAKKPETILI